MPNNVFQVTEELTNRTLSLIETNSVVLKLVDRHLDGKFNRERGDTVRIPKSVYLQVGDGEDITSTITDIEQGSIPLVLNRHKHVAFNLGRRELAEDIRETSLTNISDSASISLLQEIESDIMTVAYRGIYNHVNATTPAVGPATVLNINDADVFLDEQGVPMGNLVRKGVITPRVMGNLGAALASVFVTKIAEAAITKAYVGTIGGLDVYKSVSVAFHTNGNHTAGATPLVDGAAQDTLYSDSLTTSSQQLLVTDGWNAALSTVTAGSTFTIDGVFRVLGNATKAATASLQTFTVNADATSTAGAITLDISPAIIPSGPYQTVSAAPADNADINMIGAANATTRQNIMFHKNAITVAFGHFGAPMSDGVSSYTDSVNNVSITVSKGSDIRTNKEIVRYDVIWGVLVQNPHFAVRYTGE